MDRHGSAQQLVTRACLTALLLSSLAVAGCKTAPACPLQARTDAAKALDDHAGRQAGWQSIKAEARVTQWGRNGRIRGTVLMFLERPDRVRFDVMTQVGPAAVLTSDGETFQLSDLREGTFLHGPTCPENIARLLGISVGKGAGRAAFDAPAIHRARPGREDSLGGDVRRLHRRRRPVVSDERAVYR